MFTHLRCSTNNNKDFQLFKLPESSLSIVNQITPKYWTPTTSHIPKFELKIMNYITHRPAVKDAFGFLCKYKNPINDPSSVKNFLPHKSEENIDASMVLSMVVYFIFWAF